jgi:hypothetical protein
MELDDAEISLPFFIEFINDRYYLQTSMNRFIESITDEEANKLLEDIDVSTKKHLRECNLKQRGGYIDKSKIDANLYEFLMLCDSIHDFGRNFDIKQIHEWIPYELLHVFKKVKNNETNANTKMVLRKRHIDLMEIKREDKLISYLTKPPNLWFDTKAIQNPFRGKNIMKRYLYKPQFTLQENILLSRLNMKKTSIIKSIDFWTNEKHNDPSQFYIEQICYVCSIIKKYLGENIEWITDVSDPIYKLFTSFPIIHQKFFNSVQAKSKMRTDDIVNVLNERLHLQWTPIICDATMNDSSETDRFILNKSKMKLGFDKNPTGSVYMNKYPFQCNLEGAMYKRNGEMSYKLNGEEIQENQKENSLGANILYIKGKLKDLKENQITQEKAQRDIVLALARKRSGDWGMVENCVVNKRAFITQDKLAAMYAICRKVPIIYVHPVLKHNEIYQYTLSLVK